MRRIKPYRKYNITYTETGNHFSDCVAAIRSTGLTINVFDFEGTYGAIFRFRDVKLFILDYNNKWEPSYASKIMYNFYWGIHKVRHCEMSCDIPENEEEFKSFWMKMVCYSTFSRKAFNNDKWFDINFKYRQWYPRYCEIAGAYEEPDYNVHIDDPFLNKTRLMTINEFVNRAYYDPEFEDKWIG